MGITGGWWLTGSLWAVGCEFAICWFGGLWFVVGCCTRKSSVWGRIRCRGFDQWVWGSHRSGGFAMGLWLTGFVVIIKQVILFLCFKDEGLKTKKKKIVIENKYQTNLWGCKNTIKSYFCEQFLKTLRKQVLKTGTKQFFILWVAVFAYV